MKLFGFGRGKTKEAHSSSSCGHPVSHQVAVYGDPAEPTKMTGIKCTQCGELLPMGPGQQRVA
jgi:hypothetical protein